MLLELLRVDSVQNANPPRDILRPLVSDVLGQVSDRENEDVPPEVALQRGMELHLEFLFELKVLADHLVLALVEVSKDGRDVLGLRNLPFLP